MKDETALLHNMSGPPHSVVKYSGLADLASTHGPGGSGVCGVGFKGRAHFGTPVRFVLPPELAGKSAADILRHLGVDPQPDAGQQLAALINARARDLPLPEGCAVILASKSHRVVWADALSVLAVLAKCSHSIWLRAKSPALNAALQRRQVTLLVPPRFAGFLEEKSK